MRVPALPAAAKRFSAGGGAGLVDMVVASGLLAAELAALAAVPRDDSPVLAVAACVVMAAGVAVRRRTPTLSAVGALIGLVAYELATNDPNLAAPPLAVVLTCYTLGRRSAPRGHSLRLVLVAGLGLAATWVVSAHLKDSPGNAVSSWLVAVMAPLVLGVMLARRSVLSRRLADGAEQLRVEQDLNTAQATAEERNRVARDLHDVVAHCVSVMVVQAGAARLVAAHDPAGADNALAVIGGCGRDAMVDLRRIVGVLRRTDDPDFGCGAGLGDLSRLAERIDAAGVPTQLHLPGEVRVPPAVDVVAYRVVQEALTNVVKHAGEGATATVTVRMGSTAVTVEVTNTAGESPRQFTPSGHGLLGMKERVADYGGHVRAGPESNGGYGVRARIPFHPADLPEAGGVTASRRGVVRAPKWPSPRTAGWMIVAFWLVVMEVEVAASSARRGPWLLNAAAVATMAFAAGRRRQYPLLFLAVVGAMAIAMSGGLTSLDRSTVTGLFTLAVPLFTVAAWEPRAQAMMGLALWAVGASAVAVVHNTAAGGLAGALVMGIVVWAAGRVWRAQLLVNSELRETMTQLAAERDRRAQLAVATERTRIARDLHGPVAHGVITMVVQAEAARKLLVHQPGTVEAAIRDIERTGREALTQLRRILGVLRSPAGAPAPTATTTGAPVVARLGQHATWTAEQVLT